MLRHIPCKASLGVMVGWPGTKMSRYCHQPLWLCLSIAVSGGCVLRGKSRGHGVGWPGMLCTAISRCDCAQIAVSGGCVLQGKSGGHGVGWSEMPRYSFKVPPGWEETPVSIADLGGTEVRPFEHVCYMNVLYNSDLNTQEGRMVPCSWRSIRC
jgi:hypothetical protein